jgi:DNA-directed RNA polymerase subunit beta'
LTKLIERIVEEHGFEAGGETIDRLKSLGFEMATRSGITWAMSDLLIPKEKTDIVAKAERDVEAIREQFNEGLLTDAERRVRVIAIWERVKSDIAKLVTVSLPPENSIYQIIDSGSRGSWAQPIQMMGMKGLVSNPKGETIELPVRSSFKEGLSVLEYFISTHGARKGTTDTALKTAQAGYLTRRLVDVSQDTSITEDDCRTKEGIVIRREDGQSFGQTFSSRLFSRTVLEDVKDGRKVLVKAGEVVDKEKADAVDATGISEVAVRSPITCKTLFGLCKACYGWDLGVNKPVEEGAAVGIVAAQSIGEPGTQLTMRTFHTGGIAGLDITHGLPRVEELFEVRPPKGKAILAGDDGEVTNVEERGNVKVLALVYAGGGSAKPKAKKVAKKKEVEHLVPRSAIVYVKPGDRVQRGDQLSEGHVDLREYFEYKGGGEVARHIINEVQKIYMAEGASINNKHIEIIVRQMFSRVRIKDAGDTDFVVGEVIEKSKFLEVNRELKRQGKTLARAQQLLLGITRVALSTESFLSAASFQDTARVLVKAAIEGRVDPLRGLKENVIIGRLIDRETRVGEAETDEESSGLSTESSEDRPGDASSDDAMVVAVAADEGTEAASAQEEQ